MSKKWRRAHSGLTLIELIMVMTIIGIVGAIAGQFMPYVTSAYTTHTLAQEQDWQMRLALFRLERELAESPSLSATSSSQLQFVSGQDGSAVSYSLSGSNLLRNSAVIASDIGSLSLAYYDAALASTAALADVRCIKVSATVTNSLATHDLQSVVCPRNFTG
jgi:prepilin-type N-terminal cleavage/methylation domain-containing protein